MELTDCIDDSLQPDASRAAFALGTLAGTAMRLMNTTHALCGVVQLLLAERANHDQTFIPVTHPAHKVLESGRAAFAAAQGNRA